MKKYLIALLVLVLLPVSVTTVFAGTKNPHRPETWSSTGVCTVLDEGGRFYFDSDKDALDGTYSYWYQNKPLPPIIVGEEWTCRIQQKTVYVCDWICWYEVYHIIDLRKLITPADNP
jgi:hypothetical protein